MTKAEGFDTDPGDRYDEAMRRLIAARWADTWDAVPAVLAGEDPEAVHDLRVASRRLRAAMDASTSCFPRTWYRPLHRKAKAITRSTGAARDSDVLFAALTAEREKAKDELKAGLDHLIDDIARERKRSRQSMLRFLLKLDSGPTRKRSRRRFGRPSKMRKRGAGVSIPQAAPPGKETDARAAMKALDPAASLATNARIALAVRTADLFGYAGIIRDPSAVEQLHDARIATKRLRYTLELFQTVFGDEGVCVIGKLQVLQEALGQVHDHDVRIMRIEEELAELAGKPDVSDLTASLDLLLASERATRAALHANVVKRWKHIERQKVHANLLAIAAPPD